MFLVSGPELVIAACRAVFISRDSLVISSSALSVADFIARCRLACSEAAESSNAPKSRAST